MKTQLSEASKARIAKLVEQMSGPLTPEHVTTEVQNVLRAGAREVIIAALGLEMRWHGEASVRSDSPLVKELRERHMPDLMQQLGLDTSITLTPSEKRKLAKVARDAVLNRLYVQVEQQAYEWAQEVLEAVKDEAVAAAVQTFESGRKPKRSYL